MSADGVPLQGRQNTCASFSALSSAASRGAERLAVTHLSCLSEGLLLFGQSSMTLVLSSDLSFLGRVDQQEMGAF